MNHGRSGKIMETYTERGQEMPIATHGGEETVRPPGPVADDGIDKSRNHNAVQEVADEARAANHRAGSDGRAGVGESKLKKPESEKRNAGSLISSRNILQEEPVVADESVAVGKHESEAEGVKQDSAEAGIHHAFHQHVYGFFGAAESGFEHSEANLHAEH